MFVFQALGNANEAKAAAIDAIDKGKSAKAKLDNILDALGIIYAYILVYHTLKF